MSLKTSTDLYNDSFIVNYHEGDSSIHRREITHKEDIGDKLHVIKQGESLTYLSYKYYGIKIFFVLIFSSLYIEIKYIPIGTSGISIVICFLPNDGGVKSR
mgnify:CR=1 FL=1